MAWEQPGRLCRRLRAPEAVTDPAEMQNRMTEGEIAPLVWVDGTFAAATR